MRLQLEIGDAPEVALPALEVFLEVDAVHPLLVHVSHVFYKAHADGRRKITEYTLQICIPWNLLSEPYVDELSFPLTLCTPSPPM